MNGDPVLQIVDQLERIGKQLGRQAWIIALVPPLLVAVTTVGMSYYFSIRQAKLQAQLQAELVERQTKFQIDLQTSVTRHQAELTGYTEAQKAVQQWRADFYKNGVLYLSRIDVAFEEVCLFRMGKKNKALTTALESLRLLLETAPPGTRNRTRTKLEAYAEYVAHRWVSFDNGVSDEEKREVYKQSEAKLKRAKAALESFIRPRVPR